METITIKGISLQDVVTLQAKDESYGSSWKKRGGVGAFMMLARKWDRIETQCKSAGWDIFETCKKGNFDGVDEGLLSDIADLRCYLLLVEHHVRNEQASAERQSSGASGSGVSAGGGQIPVGILVSEAVRRGREDDERHRRDAQNVLNTRDTVRGFDPTQDISVRLGSDGRGGGNIGSHPPIGPRE